MLSIWEWVNENAGALGLILVVIPIVWSVRQYLMLKGQELRTERFKTYHDLIQQLVQRTEADQPMMLDRQLAVVFELRRFPEYFEPSLRILSGLREGWSESYGPKDKRDRLLEEMGVTIQHIQKKSNNCIRRTIQHIQKKSKGKQARIK